MANLSNKIKQEVVDNFFKDYLKGDSITIIGNRYSVSAQTVWKYIKKKGINRSMSENMTKYTLNKNYFDCIDTEAKAYFLGLLYGDGSNDYGVKNNRIIISMLEEDGLEVLETFRQEINLSRKLFISKSKKRDGTPARDLITLLIYNKHMCYALAKLGMVKNKHDKLSFPEIPIDLYNHFVRGFFDADGNVQNKNGFQCSLCSNSKQILLDIKSIVDLPCKFYVRQQNHESYILSYTSSAEAKKFHHWMYSNATIFLSRKREVV